MNLTPQQTKSVNARHRLDHSGARALDSGHRPLRSAGDQAHAVLEAHFAFDNFYNEPKPMTALAALGTTVPGPALADCFTALIGAGLWNQWRTDQAAATQRALDHARLLAAQVDDHIGNIENLLTGVSAAVSWNPTDIAANDAVLRKVKPELPPFVGNLLLFSLDGKNIGTSSPRARFNAADRAYFKGVLVGERRAIGDVVQARNGREWLVTIARPVEDGAYRHITETILEAAAGGIVHAAGNSTRRVCSAAASINPAKQLRQVGQAANDVRWRHVVNG